MGDKREYLTENTNCVIMESMKRVDVLKSIEQILVQKAYETGHISHRADGDWQKTNNGWVRVKGSPAQPTPDTDDSAERAEYERQLTEEQNRRAEEDPTGYGYEEPPSSGEYGEITEEDLIETPEVDLYDADQVDLSGYANNINIDGGVADNDDLEDVANQILLDNNLEVNDENMNKARDAMLSWLDANGYLDSDEPSDDEIYDYEDDLMYEKEALNDYKKSHPYPVLSNDGHSKGLTSEKDMFEDAVDRFRTLTDPEEERLTPSEALKQMKEEMEYGKGIDPETYTPAIESGFKKFSDWISDFAGVEKSAVRGMRSTPTTKNVGF